MTITFPYWKFNIYSLELKYVNQSHNRWICNLRIGKIILIDDNIMNLYAMGNKT